MLVRRILSLLWVMTLLPLTAATIPKAVLSAEANEQQCIEPAPSTRFRSSDRQAFLWFLAEKVSDGEQVRIDWVSPSGQVVTSSDYGEMRAAPRLCFVNALPLAGKAWAVEGGTWTARVLVNGEVTLERRFELQAPPRGTVLIQSVTREAYEGGEAIYRVGGIGFTSDTVLYVAEWKRGQWRYLESLRPVLASDGTVSARGKPLPPGEYFLIGRNVDFPLGNPFPFAVETGGFRLPIPAGEPWQITQGPNGSFSHYNRTRYAYDIAPLGGTCVVAMRAGTVYAHDLGMGQNLRTRTFGNYITIDHGDGYFSHYAHLLTGSFVVRTGQYVQQGQALAITGNSGYSFGRHLHVQVTREPRIASQSVPFQFEDWRAGTPGRVVSQNASPLCDCRNPAAPVLSKGGVPVAPRPASGSVKEGDWFHQMLSVPRSQGELAVELDWEGASELDLHLMSPSGRHYGTGGVEAYYSGERGKPERMRIPSPEPGTWRISIRGRQVASGAQSFYLQNSVVAKSRGGGR